MSEVFTQDYIRELDQIASEGPEKLKETLMSSSGLNIDLSTRNVYILDENGRYLDGSDDTNTIKATENVLAAIKGEVGRKKSIVSSYMDLAIPISDGASDYIVYIIDNRSTANELSSEILMIILPALGLGLVFSIILSFLLANIVIRPISDLTVGAQRVASGDFSQRLPVHSEDEIGVLTINFNEMAGVLERTLREIENEKNKLSTLFLHMTDGVLAFSRDGSLIHYNPAAVSMLGADLAAGPDYAAVFGSATPLEDVLALRGAEFIEDERRIGDRSLEIYFAPFSHEKGQGGALAVIHDVTEQVRTEEVRREFVSQCFSRAPYAPYKHKKLH
jgi:two-component system sensor histidine kinase VicK